MVAFGGRSHITLAPNNGKSDMYPSPLAPRIAASGADGVRLLPGAKDTALCTEPY